MPMSTFPKGFPQGGVNIRGLPVVQTYVTSQSALGRTDGTGIYWVDSVNGLDGNKGFYGSPLKTLARAIAIAKQYDIIILKPGHAETISSATALALSVADVTIIGIGNKASRPTFTLDTANTATITVSANNVAIQNVLFVANFLSIAALFTLTTASGFTVDGCEVKDTSAILNFANLIATDTTSNHSDGVTFTNNKVTSLAATGVITLAAPTGTNDGWTIANNNYKALTTNTGGVIVIATGKVLTGLVMDSNLISIVQTTGVTTAILIVTDGSTNSGWITRNFIQGLDATSEILVTATSGLLFSQNFYSAVADKSGYLLPAADA